MGPHTVSGGFEERWKGVDEAVQRATSTLGGPIAQEGALGGTCKTIFLWMANLAMMCASSRCPLYLQAGSILDLFCNVLGRLVSRFLLMFSSSSFGIWIVRFVEWAWQCSFLFYFMERLELWYQTIFENLEDFNSESKQPWTFLCMEIFWLGSVFCLLGSF